MALSFQIFWVTFFLGMIFALKGYNKISFHCEKFLAILLFFQRELIESYGRAKKFLQ